MNPFLEVIKRYSTYKPLTKFAVIVGFITMLGFIGWIIQVGIQLRPVLHFIWYSPFDELQTESINNKRPILSKTFELLKEPGASVILGPCPGEKCMEFNLGQVELRKNTLVQPIYLKGSGLGIVRKGTPGAGDYEFKMESSIHSTSDFAIPMLTDDPIIVFLPILENNYFEIFSKFGDISFTVVDTRIRSLKIKLEISPPTVKKDESPSSSRPN